MNEELVGAPWDVKEKGTENTESENASFANELFCAKSQALASYITENLLSADLKWSLFCAACNSYRFDSVLKPFPPFFLIQDDVKQIERLREVIKLCPSMANVLVQLRDNTLPPILKDLLHWVLVNLSEPNFKYIAKEEHQSIISQVSSVMPVTMPDYMFSLTYNSRNQQKFALSALNYTTKFAFHGSRLDNFYSISHYGLQVCFNKVAAFGPGIYLSNEMVVSLSYSPRGYTWGSSYFGNHISILALCEVVDHPDVRSEYNSKRNLFDVCDKSVPGKYLIVGNSDLVCTRYLLIYTSDDFESNSLMQSRTLIGWIKRHKMFTFILGYIILLLGIGSSNSSTLYKYYKRLLRTLETGGQW